MRFQVVLPFSAMRTVRTAETRFSIALVLLVLVQRDMIPINLPAHAADEHLCSVRPVATAFWNKTTTLLLVLHKSCVRGRARERADI